MLCWSLPYNNADQPISSLALPSQPSTSSESQAALAVLHSSVSPAVCSTHDGAYVEATAFIRSTFSFPPYLQVRSLHHVPNSFPADGSISTIVLDSMLLFRH